MDFDLLKLLNSTEFTDFKTSSKPANKHTVQSVACCRSLGCLGKQAVQPTAEDGTQDMHMQLLHDTGSKRPFYFLFNSCLKSAFVAVGVLAATSSFLAIARGTNAGAAETARRSC